jgi:parvulin-like peptidyl-prolyl isomerase
MTNSSRRAWLFVGALLGCLLAVAQILNVRVPSRLPNGVAARVNGREIDSGTVERTVAGFDATLRAAGPATRNRVLGRMIDEELLVQQALDSGAAETDPEVRAALVRSAINRVNAEVAALSIANEDIEAFFATHRATYASPTRYEVTALYFESKHFPDLKAAQQRAEAARDRIRAGQSIESLERASDTLPFVPPGELATRNTLANYFGSNAVDLIDQVRSGDTTPPINFGRGVLLIYVSRRIDSEVPRLDSIRSLIEADFLRQRQETALTALLDSLHKSAHIDIASAYRVASSH